jgi:hypothetical protein
VSEALPGVLLEIAEVAGVPAALAIASHAGGTRIYFPARAADDHWLVQCVGRVSADKICDLFAVDGRRGQRVDIPLFGGTYKQMMRAIAKALHERDGKNLSSSQLARELGIAQRTVHRHRARRRSKRDDRQGKLL